MGDRSDHLLPEDHRDARGDWLDSETLCTSHVIQDVPVAAVVIYCAAELP